MRAQLLAASVVAGVLGASSGHAQDATWRTVPFTGTFNNSLNWSPVTVPSGTATFGASTITGLTFLLPTTVGGFTFNPGASAYSFSVPLAGSPGIYWRWDYQQFFKLAGFFLGAYVEPCVR